MASIYYVGDWAVLTGPHFAESPFQSCMKGLEIFNYGCWLKNALEAGGRHHVTSVPAWEFYKLPPGDYEKVLDQHDVLIFSDVEAKLFQLAPSFFDRAQFGRKVLTFPDRIKLTNQAVVAGKGAIFLGGWYSFTGEMGRGGWGRTTLSEILPVTCLPQEDLVESTEGYHARLTKAGRSRFADVPFADFPPLLGYNLTQARTGSQILVEVKETSAPLVAVRKVGAGRVLAFMSDPAPHWGCNFVFWPEYARFWQTCLDLVWPEAPGNSDAPSNDSRAAAYPPKPRKRGPALVSSSQAPRDLP
jgi:uncharacterized membrane protein